MSAGKDVSRGKAVGCLHAVQEEDFVGGREEDHAGSLVSLILPKS